MPACGAGRSRDGAAIADIGIGELKAGLSVIPLLRHHAVKPDHARGSMRDGLVPDAQAVAAAAQIRAHDVEAEKGEAVIVIDAGDGRGRRAVELTDQKPAAVDRGKTGGIRKTGVPALARRPIGGERDLVASHGADAKAIHRLTDLVVPWLSTTAAPVRRTKA
jgi:hypothetical protein